MTGDVENPLLEQLRLTREEQRSIQEDMVRNFDKLGAGVRALRTAVGAQSVMLTGVAGYVHELESRVGAIEGRTE